MAATAVLAACTGGDGAPPATSSTTISSTSSTSSTTSTSLLATTVPPDTAGSVTLRMSGFTLPDRGAGGGGLRVIVRAESQSLRVRRRGAGGAVQVCPAGGPTGPVNVARCADLGDAATVDVGDASGVELQATGATASLAEVAITYLPVDRTMTIVTPSRPAGDCARRACEITLTMIPGRPGPFTLNGRPGGGNPRLVLTALPANRMLATVEGGGLLVIRATLEAGAEASLLHHEQGAGPVAPLTAEISWP